MEELTKAIVVVHTKEIEDLFSILKYYYEEYGKKCGAKVFFISEDDIDVEKYKHPKYYVMSVSEKFFADRVLLLDADILVKLNAPSIFDCFPDNRYVYMYNECPIRGSGWKKTFENILYSHLYQNNMPIIRIREGTHYNGGVTLYPDSLKKDIFSIPPWDVSTHLYGPLKSVKQQPWRNYLIEKNKIPVKDVGRKWNHLPSTKQGIEKMSACYFVHLTGFPGWQNGQHKKLLYLQNNASSCGIRKSDILEISQVLKNYGDLDDKTKRNKEKKNAVLFGQKFRSRNIQKKKS